MLRPFSCAYSVEPALACGGRFLHCIPAAWFQSSRRPDPESCPREERSATHTSDDSRRNLPRRSGLDDQLSRSRKIHGHSKFGQETVSSSEFGWICPRGRYVTDVTRQNQPGTIPTCTAHAFKWQQTGQQMPHRYSRSQGPETSLDPAKDPLYWFSEWATPQSCPSRCRIKKTTSSLDVYSTQQSWSLRVNCARITLHRQIYARRPFESNSCQRGTRKTFNLHEVRHWKYDWLFKKGSWNPNENKKP